MAGLATDEMTEPRIDVRSWEHPGPHHIRLDFTTADATSQQVKMEEIDEQFVFLRDERKRFSAAFGELIAERQNAVSALKIAAERQVFFLT